MTELPNYAQATEKECIIIAVADVRWAQSGVIWPPAEVESLYHGGWFWQRVVAGTTGLRMWQLLLRGKIGTFGRIRGTKDIKKAIDNHQGCVVGVGGIHQIPAMAPYDDNSVTVRNLYVDTGNAEMRLAWDDLRRLMKSDASAFQFAPPGELNFRIVGHGMIVNWWLWTFLLVSVSVALALLLHG